MAYTFSATTTDQANAVLRRPGRLVAAPTNTAGTPPAYGGTSLGRMVRGAALAAGAGAVELRCSDEARHPYGALLTPPRGVILRAELAQFTDDAKQIAWPDQTASGATRRKVQFPGAAVARLVGSGHAFVLAFVPNEIDDDEAIILRRAVPRLAPGASVPWRMTRFGTLEMEFLALPDTSYGTTAEAVGVIGRWADLAI